MLLYVAKAIVYTYRYLVDVLLSLERKLSSLVQSATKITGSPQIYDSSRERHMRTIETRAMYEVSMSMAVCVEKTR